MNRTKLRTSLKAYAFLAPALAILGVFLVVPVVQVFRLSFFHYDPWLDTQTYLGLDNYRRLATDPEFRTALANSFKYLVVTPVIVTLSLGLALLVEPRLPGIHFFRAAYYVPVVTTAVVVGITWRFFFNEDDGVLNRVLLNMQVIQRAIPWFTDARLALATVMTVTVWRGLGYYMVIFIAALRSIPVELIESAIVDGARPGQVFWRVKMPQLWPAITLVAIVSSIAALQVFDEIYIMTRGKVRGAITLVYYIYETGFDPKGGTQDFSYAGAMGVVLFGILLVFTAANLLMLRRRGYENE